jgi:two-component system, OmpR family, phosphate regulon sensor histidine kinase PhoR
MNAVPEPHDRGAGPLRAQGRAAPAAVFAFLDIIPDPAVVVSLEGVCLAMNAAASALLPSLRAGGALVLGLRAPDVLDGFRQVAGGADPVKAYWSERVPIERLFEVHIAAMQGEGARNVVLLLKDLTEAKKLERMRADFIANASHELRTPLASMLGFIETLQGPARDDTAAREKFLRIMGQQGRRMARLIDDLLSLSRIEQNQYVRPDAAVDLGQIALQVCEALMPLANEMGVVLTCDVGGAVSVLGDRDELLRVAENLVDNALKYGTRPDDLKADKVLVNVRREGNRATMTVTDFGAGISQEHLPRLTERFYRVDVGQSRGKNGTGLGLAIVKHILVRHRGRLTVTSGANRGTIFVAEVPLADFQA